MAATRGEVGIEIEEVVVVESSRAPPKALAPNSAEAEVGLSVEATTAGESTAPAWSTERRSGLPNPGAEAAARSPAATPAAVAASAAAMVTSA